MRCETNFISEALKSNSTHLMYCTCHRSQEYIYIENDPKYVIDVIWSHSTPGLDVRPQI